MKYFNVFFLYFGLLFFRLFAYEVQFQGINDPEIYELVSSVSQLEKLKDTPPATLVGLKRRAEGDIHNISQALQSLAYYHSNVQFLIQQDGSLVTLLIDLGPIYPFASFHIVYLQNGDPITMEQPICLEDLEVSIGQPAFPETILNAEDTLLDLLNLRGYAFASIEKREVCADEERKQIIVTIEVDIGSLTYFGPTTVAGHERVFESYFYKKLQWCEGDLYDPRKIEKTQELLELSGLFRSINITLAEEPTDDDLVPIHIDVLEGKQRSIGFGIGYITEFGPGITAEWEDRNIYGNAEKLSFRADLWPSWQEIRLMYLIPDFRRANQNLIWLFSYEHEKIKAFDESTFSLSATIERKLSERLLFSYGGAFKLMRSQDSAHNGTFDLLQAPVQLRWSNANHLLDPTSGMTFNYKLTPTLQIAHPQFGYLSSIFTSQYYQRLTSDEKHVFAAKLMFGSIVGGSQHNIPPPERFYAGSENALRGYKYLTVSPLDHDHKPIGGRSLFIYSLELRNRCWDNFGWVVFYEIGNVYADSYPDFRARMLQSVGLGLRYYTPVGPLRLDVGIPLNRRPHVDGPFQVYFSIGQSF